MARFYFRPIFLFAAWFCALGANAQAGESKISVVRSANEFVVATDNGRLGVTLYGVEAPGPGEPGGKQALDYVRSLVAGRPVVVQTVTSREDGQIVARVRLHGTRDLAELLLEAGYVWWDSDTAPHEAYFQALQEKARDSASGLWSLGAGRAASSKSRGTFAGSSKRATQKSAASPGKVASPASSAQISKGGTASWSGASAKFVVLIVLGVVFAAASLGIGAYFVFRGKPADRSESDKEEADPKVAATSRRVIEDLLKTLTQSIGELTQLTDQYSDKMGGHKAAIKKAMTVAGLEQIEKLLTQEIEGIEAANEKYRTQLKDANVKLQEQEKLIGEIRSEAKTDFLTKIPNRRALEARLKEELNRVRRHGGTFSLVLFDIDHFKQVNDRYGHQAGDKVLQATASIIKEHIRSSDSVYRFGGEEFALVLPETAARAARIVADKVRSALSRVSVRYELAKIQVTISAGVAEVEETSDSQKSLISKADAALYQAKDEGRNRIVVASGDAANPSRSEAA